MIDRTAFVEQRRARWKVLEDLLAPHGLVTAEDWSQLASGYRSVCADLARARSKDMPDDVQSYLDNLAARAHNKLYGTRPRASRRALIWLLQGVPREVRSSFRFFVCASLLFYGPFFISAVAGFQSETFAAEVLSPEALESMQEMYAEAPSDRGTGNDAAMAGFYVINNAGIAMRSFVTGVFGGLGSAFFLFYNGLMIGTVFGALARAGLLGNLLEFTSGHSAWELTGLVMAGAAGLRLGWSLIETGGLTRGASLRASAGATTRLALGAAFMLVIAAAIEGFWSAGPVPRPAKYAFGICQWLIVVAWLRYGGGQDA